jgi:hypothetical protein
MKHNFKDITGQVFGQWTALAYIRTDPHGAFWLCRCSCGTESEVWGRALRCGNSKCCERCAGNFKLTDEEASKNRLYSIYKHNAIKHNRSFELSIEDFGILTKENCFYCGVPPRQICSRPDRAVKPDPYIYNGVDRIDNKEGYTKENSVSCCVMCNRAKMAYTLEVFLAWIDRLVKFRTNPESPARVQGNE